MSDKHYNRVFWTSFGIGTAVLSAPLVTGAALLFDKLADDATIRTATAKKDMLQNLQTQNGGRETATVVFGRKFETGQNQSAYVGSTAEITYARLIDTQNDIIRDAQNSLSGPAVTIGLAAGVIGAFVLNALATGKNHKVNTFYHDVTRRVTKTLFGYDSKA